MSKKTNVIPDAIEKQLKKLIDANIAAKGEAATFEALERLFGPDTAAAIRAELSGEPSAPVPVPNPAPAPGPAPAPALSVLLPHATTFLRNGAKWTSHVLMSPKLTDADRAGILKTLAAESCNAIYVYAANEGDYGGRSVMYRREDRETWRAWFKQCIASGLRVVVWMRADDSSGLNGRTDAQWRKFFGNVVSDLDDLVAGYVTGLEVNEYWNEARSRGLTKILKELTTRPVGVHTSSIAHIGHAKGSDVYYLQTGFNKSAAEIQKQVRDAKAKFGGPVVCAEYHMSGETAAAKALGDAAIAAGAAGVGNGCTVAGIKALMAAHPETTPGPIATVKLTWRGPRKDRSTGVQLVNPRLSGGVLTFDNFAQIPWKPQTVDGKPCNAVGVLFRQQAGGGWIGGKVEWHAVDRGSINLKRNIGQGYNGHTMPAKGERVLVGIAAPDNGPAERWELVEVVWS